VITSLSDKVGCGPRERTMRGIQRFTLPVDQVEHMQQVIRYRHGGLLREITSI